MKRIKNILVIGGLLITFTASLTNCASTMVTEKTGAALCGENCVRCHDAPSPANYRDEHWEVIGMHMKIRSNALTDDEITKIVAFMQSAN